MISGSCHCGSIQFELRQAPPWLTRCNCTYCARAGGLWAHDASDQIELRYAADAVVRYIWGDKTLAFVSCKSCGCTTHWEPLDAEPDARMAVNFNMVDPKHIAGLRIRHFDGAETWQYLD